ELTAGFRMPDRKDQGRPTVRLGLRRSLLERSLIAVRGHRIRAELERQTSLDEPNRELGIFDAVAVEALVESADGEELFTACREPHGVRLAPVQRRRTPRKPCQEVLPVATPVACKQG